LSREIRRLSNERAKANSSSTLDVLFENATRVVKYGYISELQKEHLIKRLDAVNGNGSTEDKLKASQLISDVQKARHIFSSLNSKQHNDVIELFTKALEVVYAETSSRTEAERIIGKLYRVISEN